MKWPLLICALMMVGVVVGCKCDPNKAKNKQAAVKLSVKPDQETTTYKVVVDKNGKVLSSEEMSETPVAEAHALPDGATFLPSNQVPGHANFKPNNKAAENGESVVKVEGKSTTLDLTGTQAVNIVVNGKGGVTANITLNGVETSTITSNGTKVTVNSK